MKKELEKQKKALEIINSLTWDLKKKYILETKVLPNLKKEWKLPKNCMTTNLDSLVGCIYLSKEPLDDLLKNIPEDMKEIVKKHYYYKVYTINTKNILNKTKDPIALEVKKQVIKQMHMIWRLRNPKACYKIPEEEVKQYCLKLFKK